MKTWLIPLLLAIGSVVAAQQTSPYVPPIESPYASPVVGGDEGARPFYGISLDGGDFLMATDAACGTEFDFGTGAFTISARIYVTSVASAFSIWSKRPDDNLNLLVFNVNAGGALLLATANGSGTITSTTSDLVVTANAWHHVGVSRTGTTITFWLDGVSNVKTGAGNDVTNGGKMAVGAQYAAGTPIYFIPGKFYDVRVWKGSAISLAAEYANTKPYGYPGTAPTTAWAFGSDATGRVTALPWRGATILSYPGASANPTPVGPYTRITTAGPR